MKIRSLLALGLLAASVTSAVGVEPKPSGVDLEWATRLPDAASGLPVADRLLNAIKNAAAASNAPMRDEVCGCAIASDGAVSDPVSCPPVLASGRESEAVVRAVSLIDVDQWGRGFACYREGSAECIDRRHGNVAVKGETCCRSIDPLFSRIAGDANLFVTMPKPIADAVAGFSFKGTDVSGMVPADRACSVFVDVRRHAWALPPSWAGFVARLEIYASRHYGAVPLKPMTFLSQDAERNPPTPAEVARSKAIGNLQGGRLQDVTTPAEVR